MIHCHNNQHICLLSEFIYFNGFKTVFKFTNLFFLLVFTLLPRMYPPNYHVLCLFIAKKASKYVLCYISTRFLQRSNFLLAGN